MPPCEERLYLNYCDPSKVERDVITYDASCPADRDAPAITRPFFNDPEELNPVPNPRPAGRYRASGKLNDEPCHLPGYKSREWPHAHMHLNNAHATVNEDYVYREKNEERVQAYWRIPGKLQNHGSLCRP